jgi:hypothetical protein
MGYEGYDIVVCKRGHKSEVDCYEFPKYCSSDYPHEKVWTCHCGATAQWWKSVDLTNGMWCYGGKPPYDPITFEDNPHCPGCEYCDKGRIDGYIELEIDKERLIETCACCGHTKTTSHKTYKIPEGVGHKVE